MTTEIIGPPEAAGAAGGPVRVTEVPLDATERRVEAWRFLLTLASAIFLSKFLIIGGILIFLFDLALLVARAMPHLVLYVLVTMLIPFFAVWSLSRMWPKIILPASIILALLLPLQFMLENLTDRPTPSLPLLFWFAGAVLVGGIIVWNGWRVSGASHEERHLVRLPGGRFHGLGPALVAALGIHRICFSLTPLWRRIVAIGLFVLSQLLFCYLVYFLAVHIWQSWMLSEDGVALNCSPAASAARCWGYQFGRIIGVPFGIGVLLGLLAAARYAARRFARLSLETLRRQDSRAPILFLRSFTDDQIRLARPRRGIMRRLILLGDPRPLLDHVVLEEGTPFGPVVALGQPGTRPPFGAARAYVSHDNWKPFFAELAAASQVIVLAVDDTPGVRWELAHLVEQQYTPKTLFLVPPRLTSPQQALRIMSEAVAVSGANEPLQATLRNVFEACKGACIGWYQAGDEFKVFTTRYPCDISYVLAARIFL